MFQPGHVHRDNITQLAALPGQPPFSVDLYYEVRQDPKEGPMLHMRMVGEIAGRKFEDSFELHRDVAYNFASVAMRVASRHGLPRIATPIMRGHEDYDLVFADIRKKLDFKPGDPVNLDRLLRSGE